MSLHSSSSGNGEGSTPKDPLYKILDELRSHILWNYNLNVRVWSVGT